MKYLILFGILSFEVGQASTCVPARKFISYPAKMSVGAYQRIHPNGKYIMQSSMNNGVSQVRLIDIENLSSDGSVINVIDTPMQNESYPTPCDWNYISSPNHGGFMRYYKLEDLVEKKMETQPVHADNFNEFYQSIGDLNCGKTDQKKIRMMLYSSRAVRDYSIRIENGKEVFEVENSGTLCKTVTNNKYSPQQIEDARRNMERLQAELATIADDLKIYDKDFASYASHFSSYSSHSSNSRPIVKSANDTAKVVQLKKRFYAKRDEHTRYSDIYRSSISSGFASPVISPDGKELMVMVNGKASIYKINHDYSCTFVESLGFQTGKGQFSYPEKGKKGSVTFIGGPVVDGKSMGQGLYVYDRDKKELKNLTHGDETYTGSSGYSGFTKDGRVISTLCKPDKTCGALIVDPNQIKDGKILENPTGCIKTSAGSSATESDARIVK